MTAWAKPAQTTPMTLVPKTWSPTAAPMVQVSPRDLKDTVTGLALSVKTANSAVKLVKKSLLTLSLRRILDKEHPLFSKNYRNLQKSSIYWTSFLEYFQRKWTFWQVISFKHGYLNRDILTLNFVISQKVHFNSFSFENFFRKILLIWAEKKFGHIFF